MIDERDCPLAEASATVVNSHGELTATLIDLHVRAIARANSGLSGNG